MGKRFLFGLLLVFILLFSGCGSQQFKSVDRQSLQLVFDRAAEIQIKEKTYPCRISHDAAQRTTITFIGDTVLNGLQYQRAEGESTLQYDALSYPVRERGFPPRDSFVQIAQSLDTAQSYVNLEVLGDNTFAGTFDNTTFRLQADQTGAITALTIGDAMTVLFSPDLKKL